MNGLLCLLNSKYMALHFKPNEAMTDIEVSMHYKEYYLANTRQRHRYGEMEEFYITRDLNSFTTYLPSGLFLKPRVI